MSKKFKKILWWLGIIILMVIIFQLGLYFGAIQMFNEIFTTGMPPILSN